MWNIKNKKTKTKEMNKPNKNKYIDIENRVVITREEEAQGRGRL